MGKESGKNWEKQKKSDFLFGCLFCAFVIKNAYSLFVNICLK